MAIKPIKSKRKLGLGIVAAVFIAGFGVFNLINANVAQAATRTWIGGGETAVFSDPANWSGGAVPQDGDVIVMDEAAITAGEEYSQFEVTNDIVGLELTGISFVNAHPEFKRFTIVGNSISIQGVIETDDIYAQSNGENSFVVNIINLDLILTGPLTIEGVAIGDHAADKLVNLGTHPIQLTNKSSEVQCAATGISSSLIGSGAITVTSTGEFNPAQLVGVNDAYTGPITVNNGATLVVTADAIQSSSMIESRGHLALLSVYEGPTSIEITTPMKLAGILRASGGSGSHLGGCAGSSGDASYTLSGGVELIGDLTYRGFDGVTVPTNTHISAPYRPHQYSIITDDTLPGVITTDAPILDTAPAVPTGLSVTPGDAQIALSWTAPTDNGGAVITDYTVQYKTSAESTWTTFSDGVSTATSATITGLPKGQVYDVRVSAVNVVGTGSPVTETGVVVTGVAGVPTGLAATPSAGQVTLNWTAPVNNGGTAITDYTVEYKLSSDSTWTAVSRTASTTPSQTITGLSDGSSYDFRVATVNAEGASPFTTITNISTSAVAPGAPTGLTGAPSAGQVALSWTAPASNGGAVISDYAIEYKLSAASTWTEFDRAASATTTQTITGLANGSSYDFRVAAVNSAGTGGFVTITNIAIPAVVADAPTDLGGTASAGQVALTWTAPANNGGAAITNYVVQYKLSSGSTWTPVARTASATPSQVVTGLANGSSYDFRVATVNSAGTGDFTSAFTVSVPAVAPSAPQNLTAAPAVGEVLLEWDAPASTGGASITDYVVEYKLSSSSIWTELNDTVSGATTRTVDELTNGSAYDFRVAAVNAEGTSPVVTVSNVTVQSSLASAPRNLVATPASEQAELIWQAPATNGGSIVTDYLIQYKLSGDSTWSTHAHTASTATSTTITGLVNDNNYDFRVAAVNSVGTGPFVTVTGVEVTAATTVPSAPTGLEASLNADQQVVLEWTAPSNNGGLVITDYTVGYKPSADTTWQYITVPASAGTSYTFTSELVDGTIYDFSVVAVNDDGNSSAVVIEDFEYILVDGEAPGDGVGGGATDPNAPGAPNTGAEQASAGSIALIAANVLAGIGFAAWIVTRTIRHRSKVAVRNNR